MLPLIFNQETDLVAVNLKSLHLSLVAPEKSEEPMFVLRGWHKRYAEALMEGDDMLLPSAIALAERDVIARYLELLTANERTDELQDLRNAVTVLSQIKQEVASGGERAAQFVA